MTAASDIKDNTMHTLVLFFGLLLIAPLTLAESSDPFSSSAGEGEKFLKVEQAYQVAPTIDGDTIALHWQAAPSYYLYQHQFGISVRTEAASEQLSLTFEAGKKKFDEIFQKELEVYYNSTVVTGKTRLSPPYELKVSSQGCADAGLCYPPRHQYFSVDTDGNGVPDECDEDCNGNGMPDRWEVIEGFADDENGNRIPDDCEPDCNDNGVADFLDILDGVETDLVRGSVNGSTFDSTASHPD